MSLSRLTLPFVLAATVLAVTATSATAQPNVLATLTDYEHVDADDSGDVSCGDILRFALDLGTTDNADDLHDVEVEIPIPGNAQVLTETVVATNPHDTVTYHGNLPILVDFGYICSTAGACEGRNLGARLNFDLRITSPNDVSLLVVQGRVGGSNIPLTVLTDDPELPLEIDETTIPYTPCPPPQLTATKRDELVADVDADGLVDPGDTIRYHVSIGNTGSVDAAAPRLRTPIPTHTTLLAGSILAPPGSSTSTLGDLTIDLPPLGAGAVHDLAFEVRVDTTVPTGTTEIVSQGTVSDTAAAAVVTDDPDTAPHGDPTVTPLDFDPDLGLLKAPRQATVAAGETAIFDLGWANAGRATASGTQLTETVPPHSVFDAASSSPGWTCPDGASAGTVCALPLGSVAPGDSGSHAFAVRIAPSLPAGVTSTTNQATVSDDGSNGPDTNPANNAAGASVELVAAPDLYVAKAGPASAAPGLVSYQLIYGNNGTQDATGGELLEVVPDHTTFDAGASSPGWSCPDASGAGTTCTLATGALAVSETRTATFSVRLSPTAPHDEDLLNTVAISDDGSNGADLDPSDNLDSATTDILGPPDLFVDKSGPAETAAGETVVYQLAYGNRGERFATGVELVEVIPDHSTFDAAATPGAWSCIDGAPAGTICSLAVADLAPGDVASASFAVRLVLTAPAEEDLVNTATIEDDGSNGPELDPTDNTSTVVTDVLAPPDLFVSKTGPADAPAGSTLVYQLTFGNRGERSASGILLRETVPFPADFAGPESSAGWSCADGSAAGTSCTFAVPDLSPGDTGSATFAVRLPVTIPAGIDSLTNHVQIEDDGTNGPDPTPADNISSAGTDILAAPDLAIGKTDGDAVATPGGTLTYTLMVANLGNRDATGVLITDTLPPGFLVDLQRSSSGWSCTPPTDTAPASCSVLLNELTAGATPQTLLLAGLVDESLSQQIGEWVNVAAIEDDGANGPDIDSSNDTARETTPVDHLAPPPPLIAATLADQVLEADAAELAQPLTTPAGVAVAGSVVTYTAVVTNDGGSTAQDLVLFLSADPHTTFRPAATTATAGVVTHDDGAVRVALSSFEPGTSLTVTFEVVVDDVLPSGLTHLSVQGEVSASNASATLTDDPDTAIPLDPTTTPVDSGEGPPNPHDIPTASTLGLGALTVLLLIVALRRFRATPAGCGS